MHRLGLYLSRIFAVQAGVIFAVAVTITFLILCLRVADVDALRGQGLGQLLLQAALLLPAYSVSFFFVCVGLGLARGLRTLQATKELHVIHGGQRLKSLFRAISLHAFVGALIVLTLTHVVEPWANQYGSQLRAQAAADLVGRSLIPNRFAEVTDGVVVAVGGRQGNGELTGFFADDRRSPELRRTYVARSALLTSDADGYVLQLVDGSIQYLTAANELSEISFSKYEIPLERLTGSAESSAQGQSQTSTALILEAIRTGQWQPGTIRQLVQRSIDALKVKALCLFIAGIAAFPSGRRRDPLVPLEITVLAAAFFERAISTWAPGHGLLAQASGSLVLATIALVILIFRLRVFAPQPREVHSR